MSSGQPEAAVLISALKFMLGQNPLGWLSKNFDIQEVVIFQARDHTISMSSAWKIDTTW